jgi:hypothetical protein
MLPKDNNSNTKSERLLLSVAAAQLPSCSGGTVQEGLEGLRVVLETSVTFSDLHGVRSMRRDMPLVESLTLLQNEIQREGTTVTLTMSDELEQEIQSDDPKKHAWIQKLTGLLMQLYKMLLPGHYEKSRARSLVNEIFKQIDKSAGGTDATKLTITFKGGSNIVLQLPALRQWLANENQASISKGRGR